MNDERDYKDRDKDDREKKSWRDIDNSRNRSAHVSQDPQKSFSPIQDFAKKRKDSEAKKALEGFFQGKRSKEQETEWKKVFDGSPKNFSTRATAYVAKNGLPRAWEDLLRLLDHRESAFIGSVLDKMEQLIPNENKAKLDLLVGKLRVLKITCDDEALVERMEKTISNLSERL